MGPKRHSLSFGPFTLVCYDGVRQRRGMGDVVVRVGIVDVGGRGKWTSKRATARTNMTAWSVRSHRVYKTH